MKAEITISPNSNSLHLHLLRVPFLNLQLHQVHHMYLVRNLYQAHFVRSVMCTTLVGILGLLNFQRAGAMFFGYWW